MLNGQKKQRVRNPYVALLREAKKSVAHGKVGKALRKAANQNLMRDMQLLGD